MAKNRMRRNWPDEIESRSGANKAKGIATSNPRLRGTSYLGKTSKQNDNRNAVAAMSRGSCSIPNVFFIPLDFVLAQKHAQLILKTHPEPRPPSRRSGAFPHSPPASARSRRSEAETEARREGGRGDRKDGTGPVRSFVPDGTRFMFAPQPSDKSLGYFRASLRDVESRHAKHVQSPGGYPHAVVPRLLHRLGDCPCAGTPASPPIGQTQRLRPSY